MSTTDPEETLRAKKRALEEMVEQRRFGPDYQSLYDEVLGLERVVAEAHGEPHAVEVQLGSAWRGMAHFTAVVGDSFDCAVVFAAMNREHSAVRFSRVAGYRVTDVSDEIIEAHPLTGRGLTPYRAFVVRNSPWMKELESIDRIHPNHAPERWRTSQHYLLCFKDRMFEAIAQEVRPMGTFGTVDEALKEMSVHIRPVVR